MVLGSAGHEPEEPVALLSATGIRPWRSRWQGARREWLLLADRNPFPGFLRILGVAFGSASRPSVHPVSMQPELSPDCHHSGTVALHSAERWWGGGGGELGPNT